MRLKYLVPTLLLTQALLVTINLKNEAELTDGAASPEGRAEWMLERLMDPATGEIPTGIRMRELALASTLPVAGYKTSESSTEWFKGGPYNVGGRTRAFAVDIADTNVLLAGGVSGGMWRSEDGGANWLRVTPFESQAAVSYVLQDTRQGKTDTWYYGSGEADGNSASRSFSATFRGSGIYKSTDNGETWTVLPSTENLNPQKSNGWNAVFSMAIDPSRNDSDIVFAAVDGRIMRSNDGGGSWNIILSTNGATEYSEIAVSQTGVCYAALNSPSGNNAFWRSTDGINWTDITPGFVPNDLGRTRVAIAPSDEDQVYFYSDASGAKLYHYEYLSGDGSGQGGDWDNRTSNVPTSGGQSINTFNGYCMSLGVHPNDPDIVFVGGTNLYRSIDGYRSPSLDTQVGGYRISGNNNFDYFSGIQHPDQHVVYFNPLNPDIMFATSDGGIHKSPNCRQTNIQWLSLNNGYQTTQFYGIGIDHATEGSKQIAGGLQDNGTFWTNNSDENAVYTSLRGADGGYTMIADNSEAIYSSTQYANIRRMKVNQQTGDVISSTDIMPNGASYNYRFTHPFTLDPTNTDIMYLPNGNDVWVNTDLSRADQGIFLWEKLATLGSSGSITAIEVSEANPDVVYVGMSGRNIYRIDNARTPSQATSTLISQDIETGSFTASIAVDPDDEDRVIVVYSNYNVQSLWLTEDGGSTWSTIEGNLSGTPEPGAPANLYYLGNGPSFRWMEIMKTPTGKAYLAGTSIGLFATDTLMGDSTVWIQQGADVIGNIVVDMIDFRQSDRFVAVGTHGSGIYYGTVGTSLELISGIENETLAESIEFNVYPNPTVDRVTVSFNTNQVGTAKLKLMDLNGRTLRLIEKSGISSGAHNYNVDLSGLSAGNYFISGEVNGKPITKQIIKAGNN